MSDVVEVWLTDSLGLAFDGRVVELFGTSTGSERYHVRQFGVAMKGIDKSGVRRVHLGFEHRPGKISAGAMANVDPERWPELESLLRRIDDARG